MRGISGIIYIIAYWSIITFVRWWSVLCFRDFPNFQLFFVLYSFAFWWIGLWHWTHVYHIKKGSKFSYQLKGLPSHAKNLNCNSTYHSHTCKTQKSLLAYVCALIQFNLLFKEGNLLNMLEIVERVG